MNLTYNLHRENPTDDVTLVLTWWPISSHYYKYRDFFNWNGENILIMKYNNSMKEKECSLTSHIKAIRKIVKKEKVNVKNIVWFSYWSLLAHFLLESLKPEKVCLVWLLTPDTEWNFLSRSQDEYVQVTKKYEYLTFEQEFKHLIAWLNAAWFNPNELINFSNIDEELESARMWNWLAYNDYFIDNVPLKYLPKNKTLENTEFYFLTWKNDRVTPSDNINCYTYTYDIKNYKHLIKWWVGHSLSSFKDEILDIIKK